jgi:hypothetical protein
MKRYIFAYTLVFVVLLMLNQGHNLITYYHYLVKGNDVEVTVGAGIDKEAVKVIWKGELDLYIRRQKYADPLAQYYRKKSYEYVAPVVVFEKGKIINTIPFEYGKQALLVTYQDKEIGLIGHWKMSGWHAHQYKIELQKVGTTIAMRGEIIGPDGTP